MYLFRKHIVASRKESFCTNKIKHRKVPSSSLSLAASRYFMPTMQKHKVISHHDTKPVLKKSWLQHFWYVKWALIWQIIVQIETYVKYNFSAHVKGQNTLDKLLNDSVGRWDTTPCLDVKLGSSTDLALFFLGALSSAGDYVCKVTSEWSQYGIW